MATWYLLNTIKFKGPAGDTLLDAGKLIDDTKYNLALIRSAGGQVVPSSNAAAAAAATIAQVRGRQGQDQQIIDALMCAAAAVGGDPSNRKRSTGAAGATVAAAAAIVPAIAFVPVFSGKLLIRAWASFAALGAGVVTPVLSQGATAIAAPAVSSGTGGPLNYYAEAEVTGLTLNASVTFNWTTTAGDATVTLGHGATGIAASMEILERA